ncbi:MAG: histidine kinase [Candidatus Cloacimonetes bacterium HGW-Cloacimonetes-3]|jgi:signal transduction histidine kinase|nr:MAG: histidine kinase [Candidatus Cloacimonetes bacterium HGW-Cloacimonetes-3]
MQKEHKCVNIGIFNGLSEDVVNSFAKDLERINVSQGDAIISEHSWGDNLFFVCKGKVEISKGLNNPETPFAQLSILEPGEFFGEMGIINDEPRSASVIALEDVELLVIPREVFTRITFSYPIVMFNLMRTISGRLRETNERFVDVMNQMLSKNRLMAIGLAASKIIHDIKTPLTVIVLTAQLIESIYPGSNEFTDSIVKQTKLVDQLVREVLDFAKGTETPPLIQMIDLDVFFREINEVYVSALKGRNINFIVENKIRDYVYFDEGKIRRVLINLIKNSSEAIPADGELKIVTGMSSGWLQISVIDNGPGISAAIREDLFQPFISEGKPHGTGLGLAICKKLVQEHRGRLEYIPVEPHGSRFDIRIPQNMK